MCTVNPLVGREGECSLPKTKRNQKVLVVGAGPAGLLAAVSAAKNGHHVTIMEKKGELGGNLVAASGVFFKREIAQLQHYLIRQVERSGAHIGLGVEVDSSLINEIRPDVLILATGAVAAMPSIPGIRKGNVTDMIHVLSGRNWNLGGRAIVVGGGMFACETAVFLKARGNDVVMVSVHGPEKLALGMESRLRRWFILDLWPKMGIPLYSHSQLQEVVNEGLVIRHMKWGGRTTLLEGEKVIFAMNLKKDNSLISALRNSSAAVGIHLIGDCVRPRSILEALHEGYDVGTNI